MKNVALFLNKNKSVVLYLFFYALTLCANLGLYSFLIISFNLSAYICGIISWFVTVTLSFIVNKLFVFESRVFKPKTISKEIILFLMFQSILVIVEVLEFAPFLMVMSLPNSIPDAENTIIKSVVFVITIALNYIFNKTIVFKNRKEVTA